jgi:hypothetical protein
MTGRIEHMFEGVAVDGDGLSDAELITRIDALEQTKAACAAAQARLTARFVGSQAAEAARLRQVSEACSASGDFDGWAAARDEARSLELEPVERDDPGQTPGRRRRRERRRALSHNGVSAQVALARRESPSRGARLANIAVALVRHLPHTLAALEVGALNERRAEAVVRGTSHLAPHLRAEVDAEVVGENFNPAHPAAGVATWGDRELERRVRACADRLDAAAATERARVAESERRVTVRPVPDAMALVSALLPVAQAVAVHATLARAALVGKASGDERSKGQLMADTLVELVTGQATADKVPVEVQIVITDRALVDGDETPAHVPGYGTVPAGWARELVRRTQRGADTLGPGSREAGAARMWFRRLFTHPATGTLVSMESTRRLFPAALRRFVVARDGTCRTPWCDAPIAHADHVRPHASGGPTDAANAQGLCVRCNLVKEDAGWSSTVVSTGPLSGRRDTSTETTSDAAHTVRVTTPTGHTYDSTAPPLIPVPLASQHRPPTAATAHVVTLDLYRRADVELELTG